MDGSKTAGFVSLTRKRPALTLVLVLVILGSLVLESVGFAMILPVMDGVMGVQSNSTLGSSIAKAYALFGIEPSMLVVLAVFACAMFSKNVLVVLRESLRTYYAYAYRKDVILGISHALLNMEYELYIRERQAHVVNDTISATHTATLFLLQFVEFITSILAVSAFMLVMYMAEPVISLWVFSIALVVFILLKYSLGGYGEKVGMTEVNLNRGVTDQVTECVGMMREYRLNMLEAAFLKRLGATLERIVKLEVRWVSMTSAIYPLIETAIVLMLCAYITYMTYGQDIASFREKIPSMTVLVLLTQKVFSRLSQIARNHVSIVRYFESFRTVSRYLKMEMPPRVGNTAGNYDAGIVFSGVTVNGAEDRPILNEATFEIPAGKITGIIGASGAGKSTIVDTILRLRSTAAGVVRIGGVDLADIELTGLRANISVVSQRIALSNDTVHNNIRMGSESAGIDEIRNMCKRLAIDGFIESLPHGYETIVGDNAALVSGGQAQRIIIARALLRHPKVLILDEFTSALDVDTEEAITDKVLEIMKGKTVIIVSHRRSALRHCDQILKIDSGKVQPVDLAGWGEAR
jgi:ABC-type multidrug transport system fused ATPase/permease subunit